MAATTAVVPRAAEADRNIPHGSGALQKFVKPLAVDQRAAIGDGVGRIGDHLPMRVTHRLQGIRVDVDSPRLDIKPEDGLASKDQSERVFTWRSVSMGRKDNATLGR